MRPNKVGWFIVAFFLIGGALFYLTIPEILIGQIWMAVALFLAALYLFLNWRADKKDELRASGIPATGTILEMTQTGVYINNMPQVRLKLRIESQELQPYEITKSLTVPHIALGAWPLAAHYRCTLIARIRMRSLSTSSVEPPRR